MRNDRTMISDTNPVDPDSSLRMRKKISVDMPENNDAPAFKDLDYDPKSANIFARAIEGIRNLIYNLVVKNKAVVKYAVLATIFILYNAYFITALAYNRRHEIDWDWCDGHGLLIILTALLYWGLFYYHILKRYFGKSIYNGIIKPLNNLGTKLFSNG